MWSDDKSAKGDNGAATNALLATVVTQSKMGNQENSLQSENGDSRKW